MPKVKSHFWHEKNKYGRYLIQQYKVCVFNKSERKKGKAKRETEKFSREMKGEMGEQAKENKEILGGWLIAFTPDAISRLELEWENLVALQVSVLSARMQL